MDDAMERQKVLIVDDSPDNIQVLMHTLKDVYRLVVATNGEKALQMANTEPVPDIILLDIMMPGMDGYEVCARLKGNDKTRGIPVIFVTAMSEEEDEQKGLNLGAVDYITKPFKPGLVRSRVRNHLELKRHRDHLEEMVRERTMDLILTQDATIYSLATLAEYRDPETGGHIKRTQRYVMVLAEFLRNDPAFSAHLDDETISLLYKSAPLHDIGKVGVRDAILLKPGKLTAEEFEEMKAHARYGMETIEKVREELGEISGAFLRLAGEVALTHHEKWDGTGYPQGLLTTKIPVSGRLMAIADVYDALISRRVYKPPMPHSRAVQIMVEGKGTHFDPAMIDTFLHMEEHFREIALEFADFQEERETLVL